jgi:hypothetical protein
METTPPMPSRVADIKAEIIALGFGNKLTGLTEKTELIALLQEARASAPVSAPASAAPASASLRKIPVVLLGEIHEDVRCSLKNRSTLMDIMGITDGNPLGRREFLLVSEGREINHCYRTLQLPTDRIIIEYPSGQSKTEMLDKLILMTHLLMNVLEGRVKQGTGAAAGDDIPDSVTIEPQFFMKRAKDDGYWPLLQAVPNGTTIYEQMVAAAFSRDEPQFYSWFNGILAHLISSDYLNDVSMSAEIKRRLQSFIATSDDRQLIEVGTLFRLSRDADIIRQVEERARSENSTLNVIVIIFGAMHYDNLRTLIQRSDVLQVDPRSTNIIKYGGKKTKKAKKVKKVKKRVAKTHIAKKHRTKKCKPYRR